MRLPIPVQMDGGLLTDVKVGEVRVDASTAAMREASAGAYYMAVLEWCAGAAEEMSGPNGESASTREEVRRAVRAMPFASAWGLACYGMAATKGSDAIPGSYPCPKCGSVVTMGPKEEDGDAYDDSDRLYAIDYDVCDDPASGVTYQLSKPVEIVRKDTGEVVERVESLSLSWPTLGQCIRAQQRYPDDEGKLTLAVYADSIVAVNGKQATPQWKASYGDLTLSRMTTGDLTGLSSALGRYSIGRKVERACMKCKNRWEAELDLSGFFASGLAR